MKKLIITLILFLNISLSFHDGNISIQVNNYTYAQHRIDCPTNTGGNGGGGGGFFGWITGVLGDIATAIGNVATDIADFFSSGGGDDDGNEPFGDENDEGGNYGYDGSSFDYYETGQSNPWNDPYFNTGDWTQEEWEIVSLLGTYHETYTNGNTGTQNQTWAGEFVKRMVEPQTTASAPSGLPCNNRFLMPFLKIVQFRPDQLQLIQEFHFDGNNLTGFTDIYGNKFVNGHTVYRNAGVIVGEEPTAQFFCFEKIEQDIAELNANYGTVIWNMPDLNGNTRKVVARAPVNNLNYCFKVEIIENAEPGKMVEARTTDGVPYCKTLTPEDCVRGMGKKRDEPYMLPGLNLKHHINIPDKIRQVLQRLWNGIMSPCSISYINARLNELHNSQAYLNAGSESLREDMERFAVGYYMIFGSLNCLTNEEKAQHLSGVEKFGMGALNELINSFDVVAITEGLLNIVQGLASNIDAQLQALINAADQVITDLATGSPINYEAIFESLIEAYVSQFNFGDLKAICNHFMQMYFTACDSYIFSDGTTGNICPYRHGQIVVMALPILVGGGAWIATKVPQLVSNYAARTAKALKYLDDAAKAGATLTDDVSKVVVNESADEVVTVISKDPNDIKFKRDDNEFEPYPTPVPDIPTINGRKPINYEFAGKTYHTKSGFDVNFNQHGFPDMDPYSQRTVRITNMQGNHTNDFAKANKEAFGVEDPTYHLTVNNGQYSNYTWHHHEDGKSMMLVPKNINNPANGGVAHTGGKAVVQHNNALPPGATPLTYPSPPLK